MKELIIVPDSLVIDPGGAAAYSASLRGRLPDLPEAVNEFGFFIAKFIIE